MTNKPMLSIPRELLEELRNVCGDPELAEQTRLFLDNPVFESQYDGMTQDQAQAVSDGVDEILYGKTAAQHRGEPVMSGSEEFSHMSTIELRGYHAGWYAACIQNRSAEKPAPVAPFKPDTVVCRRYTLEGHIFYHYDLEPVYGSVPVTVSDLVFMAEGKPVAVVMPERMKVEPFTTIDRGSKNYKAGYNEAIVEVAKLNGLKP